MTGRELIIYILENGLEDEPVFKGGRILGLMTVGEAASKWNVGAATVGTWARIGWIDYVRFEGQIYIPANTKRPELEPEGKDVR